MSRLPLSAIPILDGDDPDAFVDQAIHQDGDLTHRSCQTGQLRNDHGNPVNTVLINNETDQPWFVAKEVTGILGFERTQDAVKYLDRDEQTVIKDPRLTKSRNPTTTLISESGLYALVMRSRRPEAKAFRKWVTGEVLPCIRQTGAYLTKDTAKSILDDPETAVTLAKIHTFL